MSGLFTSGGQITGASASVLPMNVQDITIGFRIAFRIGWFNLLAVQRTLKTLLQYHNSKTSILPLLYQVILFLSLIHWGSTDDFF